MMTPRAITCWLGFVLLCGCAHEARRAAPQTQASQTAPEDIAAVPLPAQTPYDEDPQARAAYLEFFALGYRFGASGYTNGGCLCGTEQSLAHYEASMSGYMAGKEAGWAAFQARSEPVGAAEGSPADSATSSSP